MSAMNQSPSSGGWGVPDGDMASSLGGGLLFAEFMRELVRLLMMDLAFRFHRVQIFSLKCLYFLQRRLCSAAKQHIIQCIQPYHACIHAFMRIEPQHSSDTSNVPFVAAAQHHLQYHAMASYHFLSESGDARTCRPTCLRRPWKSSACIQVG